jgi:hypothetical protein
MTERLLRTPFAGSSPATVFGCDLIEANCGVLNRLPEIVQKLPVTASFINV